MASPYKTILKWKQIYGDIFTIWLPRPTVVLASANIIKETLIKNKEIFSSRPNTYVYGIFTGHKPHGDGIILADGDKWYTQRNFALKVFREFGVGSKRMEYKIMLHTHRMLVNIFKRMGDSKKIVIDLHHVISYTVGNIIHDLVMGRYYEFYDPEFMHFKELIDSILKDFTSIQMLIVDCYPFMRYFLPTYYRYKRNGFKLQKFFMDEIERHSSKIQNSLETFKATNFIDAYLLEMYKSQDEELSKLTLALNAGDLWTGGMETTVTTLRWAILYMILYPKVQKKCFKEIIGVLNDDMDVTSEDKIRLPYVRATIDEIQRMINVLPWGIPHRVECDIEINGKFIPRDTTLLIQTGAIHFDENEFHDPDTFLPERFLNNDGSYVAVRNNMPFGIGKRQCLGEPLARMELFLIFVTLIKSFEFCEGPQGPPDMTRCEGMTTVPKPYKALLKRRNYSVRYLNNNQIKREPFEEQLEKMREYKRLISDEDDKRNYDY
ncbi:Cytochrome P450 18a1 [Strongyloides ratti]|uniref:Cytochrome P450 18a1 n=1 Tax=Strongyloides ratti TaxID=34506 RepID=A0A090L0S0_STRRB|nr:Cytochrome P450 18a1 [Strongyloides ratti]CEF63385.1 Cytochrome P450 18a1 [Strongyloides ratti]